MPAPYASVGVQYIADDTQDLYVNGVFHSRWLNDPEYPRNYGDGVSLCVMRDFSQEPKVHADRIEFWTEPGGTLLLADDFTSLAGWTVVPFLGESLVVNPASHVYAAIHGMMYRTQPVGTTYVELQGIYFDDCVPNAYIAVVFNRNNANDFTNGWENGPALGGMQRYNEGSGLYVSCQGAHPSASFGLIVRGGWTVDTIGFG